MDGKDYYIKSLWDKITNYFKGFKRYQNIDDYIVREGVEVLTFSSGVVARFYSYKSYKEKGFRVNETNTNQIIAKDYIALTHKLK